MRKCHVTAHNRTMTQNVLLVFRTWWRHQMETFSALLALCAGNLPVTDEFPAQRPVTRSLGVFFDLRLNEWLCKRQSWDWWFETPSRPLWRHGNDKHSVGQTVSQANRGIRCVISHGSGSHSTNKYFPPLCARDGIPCSAHTSFNWIHRVGVKVISLYRWISKRLQYFQCVSNGYAAVLSHRYLFLFSP